MVARGRADELILQNLIQLYAHDFSGYRAGMPWEGCTGRFANDPLSDVRKQPGRSDRSGAQRPASVWSMTTRALICPSMRRSPNIRSVRVRAAACGAIQGPCDVRSDAWCWEAALANRNRATRIFWRTFSTDHVRTIRWRRIPDRSAGRDPFSAFNESPQSSSDLRHLGSFRPQRGTPLAAMVHIKTESGPVPS